MKTSIFISRKILAKGDFITSYNKCYLMYINLLCENIDKLIEENKNFGFCCDLTNIYHKLITVFLTLPELPGSLDCLSHLRKEYLGYLNYFQALHYIRNIFFSIGYILLIVIVFKVLLDIYIYIYIYIYILYIFLSSMCSIYGAKPS